MSFIIIVALFLINLLIGIVFYNFSKERFNLLKSQSMNEIELSWLKLLSLVFLADSNFQFDFEKKKRKIFSNFFKLFDVKSLENYIFPFLILDLITIFLNYDNSSKFYVSILEKIHLTCTIIFSLEFHLKILFLGIKSK